MYRSSGGGGGGGGGIISTSGRSMSEKPFTMAVCAAGATLAALTLVYVFTPSLFGDSNNVTATASPARHRRKGDDGGGAVGLANPANDCFINSVLQALAGLRELRIYLAHEENLHIRRRLRQRRHRVDPKTLSSSSQGLPDDSNSDVDNKNNNNGNDNSGRGDKLWGLQRGLVTHALKEILDSLNERPLYRKTLSAAAFVAALERAFGQRVDRRQQDAQEFLQVVAERLSDEYYAGQRADSAVAAAEARAKRRPGGAAAAEKRSAGNGLVNGVVDAPSAQHTPKPRNVADVLEEGAQKREEESGGGLEGQGEGEGGEEGAGGFPFEGVLESQIECLTCHFKPAPTRSSFVVLTLHVPQQGAATSTLNSCLDGLLKTEHIDGYKCEQCRLQLAVELRQQRLQQAIATNATPDSRWKSVNAAAVAAYLERGGTPAPWVQTCHLDSLHAHCDFSQQHSIAVLESEIATLQQCIRSRDPAQRQPPARIALPGTSNSSSSSASAPTPGAVRASHNIIATAATNAAIAGTPAPQRRIARHVRIAVFPRILAVHLSRSVAFDAAAYGGGGGGGGSAYGKNATRVAFPERLPLGSLLHRRTYQLASFVTHRGSRHDSGHYECFRRAAAVAAAAEGRGSDSAVPRRRRRRRSDGKEQLGTSSMANALSSSTATTTAAEVEATAILASSQTPMQLPTLPSSSAASFTLPEQPASFPHSQLPSQPPPHLPSTALPSSTSPSSSSSSLSQESSLPHTSAAPTMAATDSLSSAAPSPPSASSTPSSSSPSSAQTSSTSPSSPHTPPPPQSSASAAAAALPKSACTTQLSSSWWRISDDSVQSGGKTAALLSAEQQQRDAYLLFYEIIP